jgi:hypothetical protein
MMGKKNSKFKNDFFCWKKIIIRFVSVETNPRLLVVQAKNSDNQF